MAVKSAFLEFVCGQFDLGICPETIRLAAEVKFKSSIPAYKVDIAIKNFESGIYKLPVTETKVEDLEDERSTNQSNQ